MPPARKIINDPIYGFITIDDPLVFEVINKPVYQRLRRIYQMAFAHLVYPGAVHTRLAHSLGAYHLMGEALNELCRKGFDISKEEIQAARIAILLHDVGHGPFSHALEGKLVRGMHHEQMSLLVMHQLNHEMGGALQLAISIFTGDYHKPFLHQLVSGQLDVDRMDYLNRDSFFTGVSEGVIGYDRIIKMLTVHHNELMVEEKAIYSIEKFLVARRLMYWQVYLHKTVLAAEQMLVRAVERARQVGAPAPPNLLPMLQQQQWCEHDAEALLPRFTLLDDVDLLMALKMWQTGKDKVLATISASLLNRNLFKIRLQAEPISPEEIEAKRHEVRRACSVGEEEAEYLVFAGHASNTTYTTADERINILFKGGEVKDISEVDHALIQQSLAATVGKQYICWLSID